ncbi:MAG: hypothetical protein AAB875_02550 [Patescibacteria group bacterium]
MPKTAGKKSKKIKLKKQFVFLCSCCAVILILLISAFNFENFLTNQKVLGAQSGTSEQELLRGQKIFWEEFVAENPTYLDGWIEITEINLKLGDTEAAKFSLKRAEEINPNSTKVKELRTLVGN